MIQKYLFQWILQPLARIKNWIPEKIWQGVVTLAILGIQLCQFAYAVGAISRSIVVSLIFCLFFGMIIIAGLSNNMKPLKPSTGLWFCWFGVGLFMMITGVFVEHNVLADAAVWLIAVPVFYIVWGNRGFDELIKPFMHGVYLSFAVLLLICATSYPITDIAYKGFYANQNSLALYCAGVYVIALGDVFSQKKFSFRLFVPMVVAGFAVALLLYTNARGGQLAAIFATIVAVVLSLLVYGKKFWKSLLIHVIPVALVIIIAIPGTLSIFSFGFSLKNGYLFQNDKPVTEDMTVPPVNEIIPTDIPVEEPTVSPTEAPTETPTAPPQVALDTVLENQEQRMSISIGDIDAFTSGRFHQWKVYWNELKLLGHREDHQLFYETGELVTMSSHMTLLQIAYEYGILSGVFYLLFNLIAGIKALIYAYKNRMERYSIFPVLIAICYGAVYMVEWVFSPIAGGIALAYVITQIPFMFKRDSAHLTK